MSVIFGLLVCLQISSQHIIVTGNPSELTIQRCGQSLNDALFKVCNGKFNTMSGKKRYSSYPRVHFNDISTFDTLLDETSVENDEDTLMLNYLALFVPNDQYPRMRRHSFINENVDGGIVETCCRRKCTLSTMLQFCA